MNIHSNTEGARRYSIECQYCNDKSTRNLRRITHNNLAQAFLTNAPVVPGHTLIIPYRCVAKIDDLVPEELIAIFALIDVIKPTLRDVFDAYGFNYAWNEGGGGGTDRPALSPTYLT
jgi:diadenosine tetraphosphate (Ap4A) HIT family hydrolase